MGGLHATAANKILAPTLDRISAVPIEKVHPLNMIVHIVLLKLKSGLARDDQRVQDAFTELAGVGTQVPGVARWECGWNVAQHAAAYDIALLSEFRSQADLDAYGPHPAHVQVGKKLEALTDFVFCDYEMGA